MPVYRDKPSWAHVKLHTYTRLKCGLWMSVMAMKIFLILEELRLVMYRLNILSSCKEVKTRLKGFWKRARGDGDSGRLGRGVDGWFTEVREETTISRPRAARRR
jgi:hypothetical protein